eukprot:SAG22_NODE_554_length_9135_cov_3.635569_3_plen_266_part_00
MSAATDSHRALLYGRECSHGSDAAAVFLPRAAAPGPGPDPEWNPDVGCSNYISRDLSRDRCDGWPEETQQKCLAHCLNNTLPAGCDRPPGYRCEFAAWRADVPGGMPGLCQVADSRCDPVPDPGTELHKVEGQSPRNCPDMGGRWDGGVSDVSVDNRYCYWWPFSTRAVPELTCSNDAACLLSCGQVVTMTQFNCDHLRATDAASQWLSADGAFYDQWNLRMVFEYGGGTQNLTLTGHLNGCNPENCPVGSTITFSNFAVWTKLE